MSRATLAIAGVVLAGCAGSPTSRPMAGPRGECAWQVCVSSSTVGDRLVYQAHNSGPVVATVSLTFAMLRNLRLSDSVPIVRVVQPGARTLLARLTPVDAERTVGAHPIVEIDLGSDSTKPDPEVTYGMPFGGSEPRRLVGGYGSPTHLAQNHYSLDFAMPEGTPVLAARGGVVVEVQDGYTEGGLNPDLLEHANLVVVAHSDGTLASYGHLLSGTSVTVGDSVQRGTRLGLSGSTGFSGLPHLHFHVGKRLMGGGHNRTISVPFADRHGARLQIREGEWYLPGEERGVPRY